MKLADAKSLPTRVHVMPLGEFFGDPDGQRFFVGDAQALIAKTFRKNVTKMKIDREHETAFSKKGDVIPAIGWGFDLFADEDGIWAHVDWNANGEYYLKSGEYAYISPEFFHDADGNVKRIIRLSITAEPRLDVKAFASKTAGEIFEDDADDGITDPEPLEQKENSIMDEKLKAALGLDVKATVDDAVKAIDGLNTALASKTASIKAMTDALELKEDAKAEDIVATCSKLREDVSSVDPTKYVPIDDYRAVCSKLNAQSDDANKAKIDGLIDAAVADGKITPASREHYHAFASKDFDECEKLLGIAPSFVSKEKQTPSTPNPKDQSAELTDAQRAVCSMSGLTEEEYKKYGMKASH